HQLRAVGAECGQHLGADRRAGRRRYHAGTARLHVLGRGEAVDPGRHDEPAQRLPGRRGRRGHGPGDTGTDARPTTELNLIERPARGRHACAATGASAAGRRSAPSRWTGRPPGTSPGGTPPAGAVTSTVDRAAPGPVAARTPR